VLVLRDLPLGRIPEGSQNCCRGSTSIGDGAMSKGVSTILASLQDAVQPGVDFSGRPGKSTPGYSLRSLPGSRIVISPIGELQTFARATRLRKPDKGSPGGTPQFSSPHPPSPLPRTSPQVVWQASHGRPLPSALARAGDAGPSRATRTSQSSAILPRPCTTGRSASTARLETPADGLLRSTHHWSYSTPKKVTIGRWQQLRLRVSLRSHLARNFLRPAGPVPATPFRNRQNRSSQRLHYYVIAVSRRNPPGNSDKSEFLEKKPVRTNRKLQRKTPHAGSVTLLRTMRPLTHISHLVC